LRPYRIGTSLSTSAPPARITSDLPSAIWSAAEVTDWLEEMQARLIV